jgi:hypothetical protein
VGYIYYPSNKENFTNNSEWVVILTTCVTPLAYTKTDEEIKERKEGYEHSINRWMNETNLPIYVVESSGYGFDDLVEKYKDTGRFFVYTFTPDKSVIISASVGECDSLVFCLKKMKETDIYQKSKYVLKVTGKYFLKGVEDILKNVPKDKDLFLQKFRHNNDGGFQNSEYFGMKKENFEYFIQNNKITPLSSMEKNLFDYSNINNNWTTIGYFPNDDKVKRDSGHIMPELFTTREML